MSHKHNVLIVGAVDRIEILALNHETNIVFAANYEEATEPHLKLREFGLVITDAVLSGGGSGYDIVQLMKHMILKPTLVVCHHDEMCPIRDRNWHIPRYLEVYFETCGVFHHGTITDYWSKRTNQLKRCA